MKGVMSFFSTEKFTGRWVDPKVKGLLEDQGEPREPGRRMWLQMGMAMLGAIAGVIGSLAGLFALLG